MMKENGKLEKPILIAGAGRNKQTGEEADRASEKAIQSAIDAARGKIEKNLISPSAIWLAADKAEERLEALKIPAADRPGAVVYIKPEGPTAKAYKYPQNTLEAQIERKRDGWVMTHVARTIVWPRQPEKEHLLLTQKQYDIAKARAERPEKLVLHVQEPKQPKPQPQRAPDQGVGIGG
ncbi:hypothetical protein THICB1_10180 [Thiomonas arsenitoxydans]|jgi:hypothetical protein|uniref:Uncharacterized protein n=1 Tax=Thiomonas arsenitoxydans (strain DSM 22701 / CIP 110005 / 3As) TaxID=426114 RepID=A0ABM9SZD7_THIA3|nr:MULTISPECIES: hypothetical protein [Thiomonas]CQR44210.1 hypothetical protein THICB3490057 [Thiomonas sp. CB3]CDW95871.1 hypothetical protein THICB2_720014 [Thiomonas sp. CB2]CQR26437.1 hypothetical protein THICB1_10180 [Thiomonas arsenitoxydans]CQR27957.1 hypothetical protein THICB6_130044 [Thiomonas arsenitoxydans]VDY03244.1 protein of unknown function [Thiomonas sp. Bio17B3]